MSTWLNPKHLKEAKTKAGKPTAGYWWHFGLAIKEFFFLKSGREVFLHCTVFDESGVVIKLRSRAFKRHHSRLWALRIRSIHGTILI